MNVQFYKHKLLTKKVGGWRSMIRSSPTALFLRQHTSYVPSMSMAWSRRDILQPSIPCSSSFTSASSCSFSSFTQLQHRNFHLSTVRHQHLADFLSHITKTGDNPKQLQAQGTTAEVPMDLGYRDKTDELPAPRVDTFDSLGVAPVLVEALAQQRPAITIPSAIQATSYKDMCSDERLVYIHAPTGTGKTFAFLLPLLTQLLQEADALATQSHIRCVIMLPSRELVHQMLVEVRCCTRWRIVLFLLAGK